MPRKIPGISLAVVALGALAIGPASASAVTTLKDTSGGVTTSMAVGAMVRGIGSSVSIFKASGLEIQCNESYITGEVTKNAGGIVQATVTGAGLDSNLTTSATDCKTNLGEKGGFDHNPGTG